MKINVNDLDELFDEEDGVETRRTNKGNKKKPQKMHDDFSKRDNRKPNKHKRHDKNEDEY